MRYSKKYVAIAFFITLFHYASFGQTKISAIQAKLFYNEKKSETFGKDVSGTFSDNIIDNSEVVLWNTIIGEGSAEGYSNQTIVIVEVTTIGQSNKNQILKLSATAENKVLLQQQRTFSSVGDNTKYKLLFLLNNTGCEKIALKAEIIKDGKSISTMNKTINFRCGE
jgi:hypothetical protein